MLKEEFQDIHYLLNYFANDCKFSQLDNSPFEFYVVDLKKFNNQYTYYNGNTALPKQQGVEKVIIGNLTDKIFFNSISKLFTSNYLQKISLYIFLIKIIDKVTKLHAEFCFEEGLFNNLKIFLNDGCTIVISENSLVNMFKNLKYKRNDELNTDYSFDLNIFNEEINKYFNFPEKFNFENFKKHKKMKEVVSY